jgi:hypothetical protein
MFYFYNFIQDRVSFGLINKTIKVLTQKPRQEWFSASFGVFLFLYTNKQEVIE